MKPSTSEVCGYCVEGEIGFPPETDLCPVCHGSGFVASVPRWEPDSREEARGEK